MKYLGDEAVKLGMNASILKFIDLRCPKCKKLAGFDVWSKYEVQGDAGKETVTCPDCTNIVPAQQFQFIPNLRKMAGGK